MHVRQASHALHVSAIKSPPMMASTSPSSLACHPRRETARAGRGDGRSGRSVRRRIGSTHVARPLREHPTSPPCSLRTLPITIECRTGLGQGRVNLNFLPNQRRHRSTRHLSRDTVASFSNKRPHQLSDASAPAELEPLTSARQAYAVCAKTARAQRTTQPLPVGAHAQDRMHGIAHVTLHEHSRCTQHLNARTAQQRQYPPPACTLTHPGAATCATNMVVIA